MLLSFKLIKEVLKEVKYLPRHAYKVTSGRLKQGTYPHQKYKFGTHSRQYFCWFEPPHATQNEIILFYHGGGWTFGNPELFSDRARLFAEHGYQVVMPAHRKLPLHNYSNIREDLTLTLTKLYEVMKSKALLHKKIILGGMSSGGNLAALLLLDHSLLEGTGFASDQFSRALLCGAPVNLAGMTDSFLLRLYAGKKNNTNFKKASPIQYISDTFSKPILIVHGTEDGLVSFQSTAKFVDTLKKISTAPIDFFILQNGSHLKAVSWAYENNEVRVKILDWLIEPSNVTVS